MENQVVIMFHINGENLIGLVNGNNIDEAILEIENLLIGQIQRRRMNEINSYKFFKRPAKLRKEMELMNYPS